MKSMTYNILLRYAQEHIAFRIPEIQSIASVFGIQLKLQETNVENPFFILELSPEDDVKKIMSRTVLARSSYKLLAEGSTHEELYDKLKGLPKDVFHRICKPSETYRIKVEAFGKKINKEYKIQRIEDLLNFLPLEGSINLNNPNQSFELLEYYGTTPNEVPLKPLKVYFGQWICDGQRNMTHKLSLKQRKFIGNTSMDPLLSLVMANMAKVKPGDIILDPFAGSGSLLVASANFGAYVLGTDIDYLMLHGKAKPTRCNQKIREPDESIYNNLKQYGLEKFYIDVLVADAALPLWRQSAFLDAIITDPPYGIRESTERIGSMKNYKVPEQYAAAHVPSKILYNLQEILCDLLKFSANVLCLGGRLVYWLPVCKEDFQESCIPTHPCFKLISYSEQELAKHSSRYLVTMEKVKDYKDSDEALVSHTMRDFRQKYFQTSRQRANSASNRER